VLGEQSIDKIHVWWEDVSQLQRSGLMHLFRPRNCEYACFSSRGDDRDVACARHLQMPAHQMVAAEWMVRALHAASPHHFRWMSVEQYGLICGVGGSRCTNANVGRLLVTVIVFPFELFLHGALIFAFLLLFLILRLDYWRIKRVREWLIMLRIVHEGHRVGVKSSICSGAE